MAAHGVQFYIQPSVSCSGAWVHTHTAVKLVWIMSFMMMKSYSPCYSYQQGQKRNHCAAGILKHSPRFENKFGHIWAIPHCLVGMSLDRKSESSQTQEGSNSSYADSQDQVWIVKHFSVGIASAVIYVCNIKITYCRFVAKSSQEF